MSVGAYRDFIRLVPVDPNNNIMNTVDVDHIIGYNIYSFDGGIITRIFLSSGQEMLTRETVREFEQRLKFIKPHLVINE